MSKRLLSLTKNNMDELKKIIADPKIRIGAAREDFMAFIKIYFSDHIKHPLADFHREWIKMVQYIFIPNILLSGFRNSGKSTLISTLFPLWAITGKFAIKSILLVTINIQKAEQILRNIKIEMESNPLFRKDLGPFRLSKGPWNSYILYIPKYDAWIQILSIDQSPRGLKSRHTRPEIILCDDMESLDSVKTQKSRDELYDWYKSELVPAGSEKPRYIFIGTPLHYDSLFSRLSDEIRSGTMKGSVSITPILDKEDNPTWPARFPTKESVLEERFEKGLPEYIWRVEYMLEAAVDENQIIKPEDIYYYDRSISIEGTHIRTYVSVDPAATANPSSNFSGVIVMSIWEKDGLRKVHVEQVHKLKLQHLQLVKFLAGLVKSIMGRGKITVYIEDVGFQPTIVTLLKMEKVEAETFSVKGRSKIDRLIECSPLIQNNTVQFPKGKCKELVDQITQFDPNKNNDLADALTQGVLISQEKTTHGFLEIMYQEKSKPRPQDFMRPRSMTDWVNAAKNGYFA